MVQHTLTYKISWVEMCITNHTNTLKEIKNSVGFAIVCNLLLKKTQTNKEASLWSKLKKKMPLFWLQYLLIHTVCKNATYTQNPSENVELYK